jgi:hypothetical protein
LELSSNWSLYFLLLRIWVASRATDMSIGIAARAGPSGEAVFASLLLTYSCPSFRTLHLVLIQGGDFGRLSEIDDILERYVETLSRDMELHVRRLWPLHP